MASRSGNSKVTGLLAGTALVLALALAASVTYLLTRGAQAEPSAGPHTVVVTETNDSVPPQPADPQPQTPEQQGQADPAPSVSAVVLDGPCLESQVRQFGTDVTGTSVVCAYVGPGGGFRWVRHADRSAEVHNVGAPCDSAVDRVAQDPSGLAIMCAGDTWVTGP
ncbi:hypothetical protein GOHSU_68_00020 [Gordonia hirsuta DSM 44140 = NBRC 16056]|uniref:Uncharacterized protein n=1 Tax=Gordonia hirsuta DSM 44140 = NBRC 16056 TaxID=1121927 RepID=L7LD23_9ACTN|nr:hypothetical protein [Gordonia hirsuta]GAC59010.1 hypothetical protein GOHSU_68_00020 [Gordonia hirsuta DSM 44140 = NBRC 16056]